MCLPASAAGKWSTIFGARSRPRHRSSRSCRLDPTVHAAVIWTLFVSCTIALPSLCQYWPPFRPAPWSDAIKPHIRSIGAISAWLFSLSTLTVAFLAHQAWLMSDAIIRTLWRLFMTRHHLLEWTPAAKPASVGSRPCWLTIDGWPERSLLAWRRPWRLGSPGRNVAHRAPFGVLWFASPAIAYFSRPSSVSRSVCLAPTTSMLCG